MARNERAAAGTTGVGKRACTFAWDASAACRCGSSQPCRGLTWNRLWNRVHSMQTIQVVMEEELLQSADRAARRLRLNRSALIRDALREHLKRLHYRELERREREAYRRTPDDPAEFAVWDAVAVWPEK